MAVRTRIEPIAQDIELIVSDLLSPEAQSAAVAGFARGAIEEADGINRRVLGRIPPRVVTVDGRPGAALETVRPGGNIIAEWELIGNVLVWIGQTLRDRSPIVSGHYRDGHTLLADGTEVPIGADVPQAAVYTFLNVMPYARRIEVGKTESGRDFVIQVPNRIYERTFKDAKALFGDVAKISTGYESLHGGYRLAHDQAHRAWTGAGWKTRARQSPDRVAGSAVTVPAIYVALKAA